MIRKFYKLFCVTAFVLFACVIAQAQQQQVSGTVRDESGALMPGVKTLLKDTATGTSSDANGKFALNATEDILVISFIGYTTKEIPSFVEDGKPGLCFSSFIQFTPLEFSILN